MTGKRALAVVVAIALIVGAIFLRRQLDDPSVADPGTPGGSDSGRTAICTPEVAAACQTMGLASVTVELPGVTAARLARSGGTLGADLWVAPSFWSAMVTELARQTGNDSPVALTMSPTLARSGLAFVTRSDRARALAAACASPADWACITSRAGDSWSSLGGSATWGSFTVGIDDITTTAGLMSVAAATVAHFGRSALATNDFDDDDTFGPALNKLGSAAPTSTAGGTTPLERYLRIPATASSVTEINAVAEPAVAASRDAPSIERTIPNVAVVADLVIAGNADFINSLDRPRWTAALKAAGWSLPEATDLPAEGGLPSAGVLVALTARWKQIAQ